MQKLLVRTEWQDVTIDSRGLWMTARFASQAKAEFEKHVWPNSQYANQKLLHKRIPAPHD